MFEESFEMFRQYEGSPEFIVYFLCIVIIDHIRGFIKIFTYQLYTLFLFLANKILANQKRKVKTERQAKLTHPPGDGDCSLETRA